MKNIDKYLTDEMTPEERTSFETEMERNPALAEEVAFLKHLTEDIETAELDERVKKALQDLPPDPPPTSNHQWWLPLVLTGILIVAFLMFQKRKSPPQPADPAPVESPRLEPLRPEPPQAETAPPSSQEAKDQPAPVRREQSTAQQLAGDPVYTPTTAPRLRGSDSSGDSARQALLDAVWYTEYPPEKLQVGESFRQVDGLLRQRAFSSAYARLQLLERKMNANDTLFFLKGYCLLEQGEGGEAVRYFDRMKNKEMAGTDLLEWYRGLALLLAADDGNAKKVFTEISTHPAHPYRLQAQRALKVMN